MICRLIPALGMLFTLFTFCGARAAEPTDPEATAAKVVALLLETQTLAKPPIDDARAARLLEAFIAHLDPERLYFLQSDWQEFQTHEESLDDQIKAQDLSFVKLVLERFRQRARESQKLANSALQLKHDFTIEESWPFPYDGYAAGNDDLAERWRLRIKGELLFERANDSTPAEALTFLQARYDNSALHIRCLTEDFAQATYLDLLCRLDDDKQGYESLHLLNSLRITMSFRGPKYMLPLSLVPARNGVPRLRGVRFYTTLHPEIFDRWLDWEVVAMRSAGKTHHLVGVCNYEQWPLHRAHTAVCKQAEVILELQHPQTKERTSLALTLPKRIEPSLFSWFYPSPLELADEPAAKAPAAKPLVPTPPINHGTYYPRRHHFRRR